MTVRAFAPYVVVVLALLGLALVIVKLAPVLLLVFAGIVIASILHAASAPLTARLRLPHTVAVAIVALLLAALIAGGAWLFGKQVTAQAEELWNAIHAAVDAVRGRIGDSPLLQSVVDQLHGATSPDAMARLAKGTFTALGAVVDFVLVIFVALYLALDPARYRDGLVRLFPVAARPRLAEALTRSGTALRRWLIGQLLAMVCVGAVAAIGLHFVGVPLALPLGILLGVMEFVPVVGPLAGAVVGVLIAFAQGPQLALYAVAVYAVVQTLEGQLITPLAQRWAVEMPAALTLIGIVGFGVLLGPMGLVLAMPLLVVAVTLVNELYVRALQRA